MTARALGRPPVNYCAHIITHGTPLEPPEYCGNEADWLTERCPAHDQEPDPDAAYDQWREDHLT